MISFEKILDKISQVYIKHNQYLKKKSKIFAGSHLLENSLQKYVNVSTQRKLSSIKKLTPAPGSFSFQFL
jgi:hypothetical protein